MLHLHFSHNRNIFSVSIVVSKLSVGRSSFVCVCGVVCFVSSWHAGDGGAGHSSTLLTVKRDCLEFLYKNNRQ